MILINTNYQDISAIFTQLIELENIIYTLTLTYNIRNKSWYLDIESQYNKLYSVKLVTNYPLLKQYKAHFDKLSGDLIILKTGNIGIEPIITYDNLGIYYNLLYLSAEEVKEWEIPYGI